MKVSTDRYVLEVIFEMYESAYPGPSTSSGGPANDPYVAIDINAIAEKIGCSPELLFGRLYYHLDAKYRYKQDNGALVPLFQLQVGGKRHAVQFPYLASILAGLNQEHRKLLVSVAMSAAALALSLASLFVSIFKH